MTTNFSSGRETYDSWITWLSDPNPQDNRHYLGAGFDHVRVAPESVILLGGMPGAGKTALTLQWAVTAMEADSTLTTLVANVEMPPRELWNRMLARLSGISLTDIRQRNFDASHLYQRDEALDRLEPIRDRLTFLEAPFSMANLIDKANESQARLIVVDYVQRFRDLEESTDRRQSINSVMDTLRLMANHGAAVIVLSSLSRSRDARGRSSYESASVSLASFKESGELEYGADDALLLCPQDDARLVDLKHEKSRYGERRDVVLSFDGRHQSFFVLGARSSSNLPQRPTERRSTETRPEVLAQIRTAMQQGTSHD